MTAEGIRYAEESSDSPAMADDRLVPLLREHKPSWETLHERYGPLLQLVRTIIGVVPNCDQYLEIWEPGFRTYNIMVPNFLNLPFSIFGFKTAPAEVAGMAAYVASRTAECPYCSAHTCSLAIRRGASPEKMAQALVGGNETFTPGELATIAVSRAIARVPSELTARERDELIRCYGREDAEWIVLAAVMMGFLNKFMDAIGVELEASTVAEVSETMGADWETGKAGVDLDPGARRNPPPAADTLWTKMRIIPYLPKALSLDKQWQQDSPDSWPEAGIYLRQKTGHEFPVLSRLQHGRIIKSVASMLRENLDPSTTVIGLDTKMLAGIIFTEIVQDTTVGADVRALAAKRNVSEADLDAAARFALDPEAESPADDPKTRAALILTRAASPSPAEIDAAVVAACRDAGLSAPAIVEVITWISVLQMLHRLTSFFMEDLPEN